MWLRTVSLRARMRPQMSGQPILKRGQKHGHWGRTYQSSRRPALRRLIKKTGRHSDGGGLYFRVIGGVKAYFVYRYRVGGRERETSLGPFPELTLAEAREKHAALRKRVVVDRADPLAEKRGAKIMPAAWPTSTSRRTRPRGAMRNIATSGGRR
jgi:hypothetical protein